MKLIIKQKVFSWFGDFNVFDENNEVVYKIKGQPAIGHKFAIYDVSGEKLGWIKQKVLTLIPTYKLYYHGEKVGSIRRTASVLKPKYTLNFGGYKIAGEVWGMSYNIKKDDSIVATINKKILASSNTYEIETKKEDALNVVMVALAVYVENCNREDFWNIY